MLSGARFTTLIVTYNSCSEILPLLTDIYEQAPPPFNHIIIVDNASADETVSLVKSHFPEVNLIANQANVGFGRAVNQGFSYCDTDSFFLLNPDIRISDPQFFRRMLEGLERTPEIAAVGPLQFKESRNRKKLNFTWSYWNPQAFFLFWCYKLRGQIPFSSPIVVTFLNAGCLLIRSSAFRKCGKCNEQYFLYGEEPDLGLKFKELGYECRLIPTTHVIHHRETSIKSLRLCTRISVKVLAIYNIFHALIIGSARILRRRLEN